VHSATGPVFRLNSHPQSSGTSKPKLIAGSLPCRRVVMKEMETFDMNQVATINKRPSLVDSMAAKYDMDPRAFVGAIKSTVIKGDCSDEQFAAFLMVAKEYDLNPLTKEIYAFPDRGGIQPIVSIDGWMNLINSHPQFDGMEFADHIGDDGKLASVECRMFRKDRNRPTAVIEYMSECVRSTDPWKKWPNRMLRHKAAIQCARYAFGFSGIMEPDEYERMKDVTPERKPLSERLTASKQPGGDQPSEGFSTDHIDRETGEIRDAEYETVGDGDHGSPEPEPANAPGEDGSPSDASPGDEIGQEKANASEVSALLEYPPSEEGRVLFALLDTEAVSSLSAADRDVICYLCNDLASEVIKDGVNSCMTGHANTLNGLSPVGKRLARGAQQARIAQIEGAV
jgi:phage recombination protein Bet